MGCDIHIYVEKKVKTEDKRMIWINVDNWKLSEHKLRGFDNKGPDFVVNSIYDWRNYHLFGILADVRNEDDWPSIHEPRGIPSDISKATEEIWFGNADWCHTPSYLTLKELLEYDWNSIQQITGMVDKETAKKWNREKIKPSEWCRWTNREDYEYLTWDVTAREMCGHFLETVIPELKAIAHGMTNYVDGSYESDEKYYDDVRIVFWFDN